MKKILVTGANGQLGQAFYEIRYGEESLEKELKIILKN